MPQRDGLLSAGDPVTQNPDLAPLANVQLQARSPFISQLAELPFLAGCINPLDG